MDNDRTVTPTKLFSSTDLDSELILSISIFILNHSEWNLDHSDKCSVCLFFLDKLGAKVIPVQKGKEQVRN